MECHSIKFFEKYVKIWLLRLLLDPAELFTENRKTLLVTNFWPYWGIFMSFSSMGLLLINTSQKQISSDFNFSSSG